MLSNPYIHVVEVTRVQLLEGLALYKDRPDKVCHRCGSALLYKRVQGTA